MADHQFITRQGVVVPDTGTTRDEVVAEFKAAFGDDLITTSDTPQGVLIDAETEARDALVRNNAAMANQINPNVAEGVFLDAIWALTGGRRLAGTRTVVNGVRVMGVPGTPIPAGALATTTGGAEFRVVTPVTLDIAGEAFTTFESVAFGPVECGAHQLVNVSPGGPLGWEAVNNDAAGTLGTLEESDTAARQRRRLTLALQGTSLAQAIVSALYATAGVKSLAFRENYTAADAVIDGINVKAHSIFTCVDGGTDADVAAALLENKSQGCGWSDLEPGPTSVNVTEPASGQVYPVKSYRPADVNIQVQVQVTVRSLTAAIVDPIEATKAAMVAYASGAIEGEQGFVVGGLVSAFELAGAVNRQNPGLLVSVCQVAVVSGSPVWGYTVAVSLLERAVLTESNIAVTVLA